MKKQKKVVILSYYRFPCTHAVLENVFAKELGKKVDMLWFFQGEFSKDKKQRWHNSQVVLSRAVKGNHYLIKFINKLMGWQKLFQLLRFLMSGDINIVLVRDLPFEAFLIAPLRLFFKFKLYYQYSSPLGDMHIGNSEIDNTLIRFWHLFQGHYHNFFVKKVIKTADIIFPITNFFKKTLLVHVAEEKMIPITMGVDEDLLNKDKKEIGFLKKMKEKYFLITYFGTLGFLRNPQFILKVFAEVKKQCPECKLILMGKTAYSWQEKELKLTCSYLGIEKDVIFTGQLDRNDLYDYLYYCDLSLSIIPPHSYYKISSPTKLYESLGNGVPVVANKGIYEQEKVVLESGGGFLVDYEIISLSNAIVEMLNNADLRKEMAKKGRNYVINHYSYRKIAKKILPYFTDCYRKDSGRK
ncbi:glycosyltransferase [Desulfonema magnum]|nr:glycosyltransferase [Desulfonema magnum]